MNPLNMLDGAKELKAQVYLVAVLTWVGVASTLMAQAAPGSPQATAHGPHIYLQDTQVLPVAHSGPKQALKLLSSGAVKPLSLAQGDFQESGVPSLVVGYGAPGGNVLAVHRGNLDAFAPQSRESWEAIRDGHFPSPFLLQADAFEVPERPDFLEAGYFSGQGHLDLVLAARGRSKIYVLAGNGQSQFKAPMAIPVAGAITALAAGKLGANTPYTSVLVGVRTASGYLLSIYRGSEAGLVHVASLPVAGEPTQIALGDLNGDGGAGAAIVADGQVMLLDWPAGKSRPILQPSGLASSSTVAVAAGRFMFDRSPQLQLALLESDGSVQIAAHAGLDARPWTGPEVKVMMAQRGKPNPFIHPPAAAEAWQIVETFPSDAPLGDVNHPPLLLRGRISSRGADDVMLVNGATSQMTIISHPNLQSGAATYGPGERSVKSYAAARPLAGLAMRVNVDGRPGLIMLLDGSVAPVIAMPLPDPTFTVNTTADTVDANPGDGICADSNGQCSLRAAVMEANATQGNDTIMLPVGTFQLTIPYNGRFDSSGGHLDINDGVSIVGTANPDGTPGTIIEAGTKTSNGIDKVFAIDFPINLPTLGPSFATSMSNIVCRFGLIGANELDQAGGCLDADAGDAGTGSVALTNVVIQGNTIAVSAPGFSDGGGIALFAENNLSGGLTITQSIVGSSNPSVVPGNVATDIGGGIFLGAFVPLTMSNTQVLNNQAVDNTGGGGAQTGGGIAIIGTAGATGSPNSAIHASLISGNQAGNQGGGIYTTAGLTLDSGSIVTGNIASGSGGGLYSNNTNETTSINNATFTGNTATVSGGAIQVDTSTVGNALNLTFSRVAGNTSPLGSGISNASGTVTASDDWWGCNQGPGGPGCDQVNGSAITFTPFITLSFKPAQSPISNGTSTTLTASLLQDNQNNILLASQILPILSVPALPPPVPAGLPVPIPISFGTPSIGNITPQPPPSSIQSSGSGAGTAVVTYNATALGTATETVTVDGANVTASIVIVGPLASLSPTSLNFGNQQVGTTSAAQTVTLKNTGTAALSISSITTSGDFAQTNNCGTSLAAGNSCPINVTFTPTTIAGRSGNLSVTDNAPGSPHTASLNGTGTRQGVAASGTVTISGNLQNIGGAAAPSPDSGSPVVGFADSSGVLHWDYLSSHHAIDLHLTAAGYAFTDATALSGAPAAVGSGFTSFQDPSGGLHWAYLGSDAHVYNLFENSGSFGFQDATAGAGAPAASAGSALTGFAEANGTQHWGFMSVTPAGAPHVYNLFWTSSGAYGFQDATAAAGAPQVMASFTPTPLSSFVDTSGGLHWAYLIQAGPVNHQHPNVLNLYDNSGSYGFSNATVAAGANIADTASPLSAFADPGGGQHWAFFAQSVPWTIDWNACCGYSVAYFTPYGAPTGSGSLVGFADPSGGRHWFYVGLGSVLSHVSSISAGGYQFQNLGSLSGAPAPLAGTSVSGFADSSGGLHFAYIGTNKHVYHVFSSGGGYSFVDASALAGTTWDAGTVALTIANTYTGTAKYGNGLGQDSTGPAVAADLVAQIKAQLGSNPPFSINVPAGGTTISIQWNTVGSAGNVPVVTTSTTTQTGSFSIPSFTGCGTATSNPQTCNSSLSGGIDPFP